MPFAPGNRANPKGRPKGARNKRTVESQAIILDFLKRRTPDEIDALWEATKAESPSKAFGHWVTSQEFVSPKLARHEVSGPDGDPLTINVITYAPTGKE